MICNLYCDLRLFLTINNLFWNFIKYLFIIKYGEIYIKKDKQLKKTSILIKIKDE